MTTSTTLQSGVADADVNAREPLAQLYRDLRTSPHGLAGPEAARRTVVYGPDELTRRTGRRWPGELLSQFGFLGPTTTFETAGGSLPGSTSSSVLRRRR